MKQEQAHNIVEVLQFCRDNKLPARVVGDWVWIKFSAKPKQSILDALKDLGFRWSKRRKQWAHNCGHPSKPAQNYAPWDRYPTRSLEETLSSNN